MSFTKPTYDVFVRDFSSGYLDSPQNDQLPLSASPDARNGMLVNVQVDENGRRRASLRRRTGARLINPTAMASATPVETLANYERDNAAAVLLAICNGGLFSWDGGTTFGAIAGAGVGTFTAGRPVQFCLHKNLAFIMDGDRTKLYDGATFGDPGLSTPGAPGLAVAAGPGVTGDYDGFVAWVNSSRVIESSPSPTTAVVTFANQQRQWTRPAAPPASATHWRVYSRKSTERQYYQTGVDQLAATATYTEAIADAARVTPGPNTSVNDPPPAFEGMVVWQGYGIAWQRDASEIWVSKRDYMESWHPSQRIALKRNQKVRSVALVGEDCLIQTDTQTFRLEGDKFPFRLKNLHTQWGNASAQSWQEIDGVVFGFDKKRGPYETDTVNFVPIADNKIKTFLNTLNVNEAGNIRAVHYQAENLVLWAVSTGTQSRRRYLLAYNYRLHAWLPPITGLEFGSLVEFTKSDNTVGLFMGDYWGRVYQFFDTDRDGVPSGTDHTKTITAATSSTLTCAGAAFYTTGDALAGMPVGVLSPTGAWQLRRIQSNTGTVLTLDTTHDPVLSTVPNPASGTWTAVVGVIEFYWWTPWLDMGVPQVQKRGGFLLIQGGSSNAANGLDVSLRFNGVSSVATRKNISFPSTGGVWGVGTWGVSTWGGGAVKKVKRRRIGRAFYAIQVRFANYYPDQPFEISGYGVGADPLPRRRAA